MFVVSTHPVERMVNVCHMKEFAHVMLATVVRTAPLVIGAGFKMCMIPHFAFPQRILADFALII